MGGAHRRKSQHTSGDGLGDELGIWDKLLTCLKPTRDFVPNGNVEARFIERYPDEARTLFVRYGHRWRDPEYPAAQYSMSAYLASRLRDLANEGHLELTWRPATGPWAYNEVISHWRLARTHGTHER